MFRRVDWMRAADHAILTVLGGTQRLELTPNNVARNIGYNNEYVAKRCKEMAGRGLLRRDDVDSDPFYAITDLGQRYLSGDVDVVDISPEVTE